MQSPERWGRNQFVCFFLSPLQEDQRLSLSTAPGQVRPPRPEQIHSEVIDQGRAGAATADRRLRRVCIFCLLDLRCKLKKKKEGELVEGRGRESRRGERKIKGGAVRVMKLGVKVFRDYSLERKRDRRERERERKKAPPKTCEQQSRLHSAI